MENYDLMIKKCLNSYSPKFLKMANDAKPYVEIFCRSYDLKLIEVNICNETENFGLSEIYFAFNNNTGGHSLTSIIKSLLEKKINLDKAFNQENK